MTLENNHRKNTQTTANSCSFTKPRFSLFSAPKNPATDPTADGRWKDVFGDAEDPVTGESLLCGGDPAEVLAKAGGAKRGVPGLWMKSPKKTVESEVGNH